MKRILLALTMVGLLLPLASRAQTTEVSLNFFYDNLESQGSWIDVADYGYCFQPNAAVNNPNWRPYSDGYWAYTDAGWTWVSYEDFGWATYHYGRWSRLTDFGWVWVPGYEWAPAWVSWRTGGDYVGWAPLPPSADRVYEGRAITGQVDVEFDIGPQYYNFIDVRYIGEPVLRDRIFEPQRNVTIINRTVNVTNITYNNSIVYNYGPDYNRLNLYSTRPIQRLSLQRETTINISVGAQGGRGANFNRVNGNQLMVMAPPIQRSQQKFAPKQVKAKVAQPKIERGWQGVADRAKVQQEMKSENAQNIPPPSFQPQKDRKREEVAGSGQMGRPGAAPANDAAGAASQQPAHQTAAGATEQQPGQAARGGRKGLKPASEQAAKPGAAPTGEGEQAQTPTNERNGRAGRMHKGKAPRSEPGQTPEEQAAPRAETPPPNEPGAGQNEEAPRQQGERTGRTRGKGHRGEPGQTPEEQTSPRAETPSPNEPGAGQNEQTPGQQGDRTGRAKTRRAERPSEAERVPQAQESQPAAQAESANQAQEPKRPRHLDRARPADQAPRAERGQGAEGSRRPEQAQPSPGGGAPVAGGGEEQHGKGKKKKPAAEPSPTP